MNNLIATISPLGWIVFGSGIAALTVFPILGWHELLVIGVTFMALLLMALLLAAGSLRCHATITTDNHRLTAGDVATITVETSNTGIMPLTYIHGDLPIGRLHHPYAITHLAAGRSTRTTLHLRALSRAALTVGPLRMRKGDPFGLIRRDTTAAEPITIFIHPPIVSCNPPHAGLQRDLEGAAYGRVVNDDLDFQGLREYEPGDDLRNIHWLSSAKTGVPMIRQYQATHRTDMSITLGLHPDGYGTTDEFELAVSIYASLSAACITQQRMLSCHAGTRHTQPCNVTVLLDEASAIVQESDDHTDLVDSTLRHSPAASLYCFVFGSNTDLDDIRRMALALPRSADCVMLQADATAQRTVRRLPECALATISRLDDLPLAMEALAVEAIA